MHAAPALVCATIALLALGATGASAVIVKVAGHRVSYQPLRRQLAASPFAAGAETSNLIYHGGPVMTSNTNYTFYWDPAGGASYPAEYTAGVDQYLQDLAHDSGGDQNVDSVATQYANGAGEAVRYESSFAGAIYDTDPYPPNGCTRAAVCLTDAQIQEELKSYVLSHHLPTDLAHEYFVLTPPGVEDCFEAAGKECSAGTSKPTYCAYHGSFGSGEGPIVYANDPYVTEIAGCDSGEHPSGKPSEGAIQGGLSHEHNESITDPELNAWYGPEGKENGDKCRTFVDASEYGTPLGTAPDGARYNQLVSGDEYWYQQEWSNAGSTCKQRLSLAAPSVTKLAPAKGPAGGGTSVKITGTGFSGVSAVHFGASAASFTIVSSTQLVATSPEGATGTVDVTVTTAGGTSAASTADHFKYVPSIASVTPASGSAAGGTSVTIAGAGFALGSATVFKFGAAKATAVECVSAGSCVAKTPRHAAGAVDVKASVSGATSAKSAGDRYTYR